ncbi:MAG TPA: Cof-type HAD-IIB family hydrolase [Candidatus Avibacteroides faecavium]|nr:Cof-type HAD-IIB family hydrolase [Candidatus Avibacteroides faecavium]
MKYRLLVLDVDGTLLNSEHQISKRTVMTLRKVQQMGVQVVLSSGRPTYGILPLAKILDLASYGGYIIPYNGSQIIDMRDGRVLFEKRITPDMVPYVERKADQYGFDLMTYAEDVVVTNNGQNDHVINEAAINGMKLSAVEDLSISIDFNPSKLVLVSDDPGSIDELEQRWEKRLSGTLDVMRSEDFYLEVVPSGVSKANTLGVLLDMLGVKTEEVVAMGDGVSDVGMIQQAALGIAMGNARDSVKRCADTVTLSNDEDGVAVALEKIFLANVMLEQISLDDLNERGKTALMGNLGIQYTYISAERIEATMPVDHRTRQPFGILHGGATLALAETVAGLGSLVICAPDEIAVGMQVSGNHVSSAHEGDSVRAVGTIIHKGRSSHVWNVDVFTSTGKLVSSVRVVNSVMKRQ